MLIPMRTNGQIADKNCLFRHSLHFSYSPHDIIIIREIMKDAISKNFIEGIISKNQIIRLAMEHRIPKNFDMFFKQRAGIIDADIIAVEMLGDHARTASDLENFVILFYI